MAPQDDRHKELLKTPPASDQRTTPAGSSDPFATIDLPQGMDFSEVRLAAVSARYELEAELGRGGMGIVYRARDKETNERVALKVLKPEIASEQVLLDRFKNELKLARKITHKHVCRSYELLRFGDTVVIAMEYVEGESLRAVLDRFGSMSTRKGIQITQQVCWALREAHAQGIVHRDLKPENLMLDRAGNVKVMDFGIARSVDAGATTTGGVVGTPAYMAPEQAEGKPVDARTDIYALGLILYEMFTGSVPFKADTPVALVMKQIRETPSAPRTVEPTLPAHIEKTIVRCLEKNPAKRFQTVDELEAALTTQAESAATPEIAAGEEACLPLLAEAKRHKAWVAATGAILCVLVGAAGFGVYRWAKPGTENPPERMTITPVTRTGYAAAISPDGRYIAYITYASNSLLVRQLATGGDMQVLAAADPYQLRHAVFSPDGNYFYVHRQKKGEIHGNDIVQIPVLGGAVRPLAVDAETAPGVSPDGKRIAFIRNAADDKNVLVVVDVDSGTERIIATRQGSGRLFVDFSPPAWSPDGQSIAVAAAEAGGHKAGLSDSVVVLVSTVDGGQREIYHDPGVVSYPLWLPGGKSLLFIGNESAQHMRGAIFELSLASGAVRRITNDQLDYSQMSVSADAGMLVAVQYGLDAKLLVGPDLKSLRYFQSDSPEMFDMSWLPDGKLLAYDAPGTPYEIDAATGRRVTTKSDRRPCGRFVLTKRSDGWWRTAPGEAGGTKLGVPTEVGRVLCSADGVRVAYITKQGKDDITWAANADGTSAVELTRDAWWPTISPNGQYVAYVKVAPGREPSVTSPLVVQSTSGGPPLREFHYGVSGAALPRWAPDSQSIWYARQRPTATLWRQPLSDRPPERLMEFPEPAERIWSFDWSPDGKQFAIVHGGQHRDIVLLRNFQ